MILSKAPLRISLAGGGTDLPSYYEIDGGEVFSFSIDKFVYLAVHDLYNGGFRLNYSKTEQVSSVNEIQHPILRMTLQELGVLRSLELGSFADIPSSGSGLGSSSAFTVALINSLRAFEGHTSSPSFLANLACKIEIERVGDPIGKQDQFASAYGGINTICFLATGETTVTPSGAIKEDKEFLDSCLTAFYLGFGRSAAEILQKQKKDFIEKKEIKYSLDLIKALVTPTKQSVRMQNVKDLGSCINEGWNLKRSIGNQISSRRIDEIIEIALKSGAVGAKVLGAGGGGFVLVCHEPGKREFIKEKLNFLRALDFKVSLDGASIVYNDEIAEEGRSWL
jgi:D-glycero-alpha-D-manno-heptose-7-phosphate kinase